MRTISLLGSTGSIGTNTLDVVRKNRHLYQVYALAAGQNVGTLAGQIAEFGPKVVVLPTLDGIDRLRAELIRQNVPGAGWPEMACGPEALVDISTCSDIDTVISAIVGVAGLEATYEAARAGKPIGLANKEVLVA